MKNLVLSNTHGILQSENLAGFALVSNVVGSVGTAILKEGVSFESLSVQDVEFLKANLEGLIKASENLYLVKSAIAAVWKPAIGQYAIVSSMGAVLKITQAEYEVVFAALQNPVVVPS